MLLSIVITTRNRILDLLKCINSIKNSDLRGIDYEIIIIDDASTDDTASLVLENCKIIHNDFPQMMVRCRNIGVKVSNGEHILFIDDDNILDPKMIKILMSFSLSHPYHGIVGPSMYYLSSKEKYMDYQTFNFFTGKTSGIVAVRQKSYFDTIGVPNVFMIKRHVFNICGYFDEDLVQTFTEPDFSLRASSFGFKSAIIPAAKTYHNTSIINNFSPRGLGGMFVQKAYCLMRNRSVLVLRYGTYMNKIVYLYLFSYVWPILYSLLILRYKRFDLIKLYWLGYRDGILYLFTRKLKSFL